MVFIMRFCTNAIERQNRMPLRSASLDFARLLCFVLWLAAGCLPVMTRAAGIEIRNPVLIANEEGHALSAEFHLDFSASLERALEGGVTLYFVTEFELLRPRWYWTNERILTRRRVWRLSHHALTRQYRLSSGALHQSFATRAEAMRVLSRLYRWQVIEQPLKPGETYVAGLRFSLDISQLPKPFQLSALMGREWNLDSGWTRWSFVAEPPPPPAEVKTEAETKPESKIETEAPGETP